MPGPGNRMRNPRPFGRNMNSNQGSGSQNFGSGGAMASSGGPLMTNHLQLHELDLELALLKRKREMIETQHNMLVSDNRFSGSNQYGFNQAPQSYGQRSEPTRNFSSFYNDGPGQQADRFATPQGMKRRAIDPWDNSAPPKRFNATSGPKRTPGRYEPRSSQPPPLMGSYRQRRPAPASTRTNFKPTKVTKPKPNAAPNKLNSVPVAERKNLVDKASNLVQKSRDSFLYEADKPANHKLLGRLELALGSIVREMREAYGAVEPHVVTFTNMAGQRALKQALRERIRAMMLGKLVGTGPEVVALYRKEYPKETDLALLDKARENIVMKGNLAIELIKRDNPERFFRHNFKRLLDASLNTMFERMEKLYKDVEAGKPLQEVIDSMLAEADKELQEAREEVKEIKENGEGQSADNTATTEADLDNTATEADPEAKENGDAADENAVAEETAANPEENEAKPADEAAKPEEGDAKPEDGAEKPEDSAETAAKPDATTNEANKEKPKSQRFQNRSIEEHVKARFYTRLMENLMKRNLPLLLPKYKEFILKILGTEAAFKETKAFLVKTTDEKVDEKANNSQATPTKSANGSPMKRYKLFVKVMGRPGLPKKGLMKSFLDNFHPTLVKKHRNMHNVLFIAFDSQENFDNILAKNGETIGNCKLDIRVSERINKNKTANEATGEGEAPANGDVEMEDGNKTNESIELNDTLDDQITDLLTSIREEEEKPENEDAQQENEGSQQENENAEAADDQAGETENQDENNQETEESNKTEPEPVQKEVEAVKTDAPAKGTPTKAAAKQAATPSAAVRTRRSSRLPQN
ncbi:neurofilament heavy polypeptide-like [Phthorimaea operculella]|nr:neurofilament heavy polypeptide-like [Phthorimaea operculella]